VPPSIRQLRWRRIDPRLMPLGQLRNDILLYLLCMTPLVDCFGRNTQPSSDHVARCGALMIARNKYHLVFTSMKFVSDDEVVSEALERGASFRNKYGRICFELIKMWIPSTMIRRYTDILNLE
jgi:hypothetical protein